jgi:hypothetical protein
LGRIICLSSRKLLLADFLQGITPRLPLLGIELRLELAALAALAALARAGSTCLSTKLHQLLSANQGSK